MSILPLHILAGSTAIISGFVSLFATKGAAVHRKSGIAFVGSMLVMSASGTALAMLRHSPGSMIGGLIAFYFVSTAFLTVRHRDSEFRWLDVAGALFGVVTLYFCLKFGFDARATAKGSIDGVPAATGFVFGTMALLAVIGDVRMIAGRDLRGGKRIARHVWRIGWAMFIATGSFFLGQAKVMPESMRILPLLAIPVVITLALTLYWFVRVRFARRKGVVMKDLSVRTTIREAA